MKTICMFCTKKGLFNIHTEGRNNHTIKDDMIEFFGYKIEHHLRPDDTICGICTNVMENLAKLKRALLPLIYRNDSGNVKLASLGKKWDIFASLSFSDESVDKSPTLNELVTLSKVVPCDSYKEQRLMENERIRSLSRASSSRTDVDSEVARVFARKRGRRKKRKGHGWSKHKTGRYSRTTGSPVSVRSLKSTYTLNSSAPQTPAYQESPENDTAIPVKIFKCQNCDYFSNDLNYINQHKIDRHRLPALFWCNFCQEKYTCREDLTEHESIHIEYKCIICGENFTSKDDYRNHYQYHIENSVLCTTCGKRYVDQRALIKHKTLTHIKRNIPSRIDYQIINGAPTQAIYKNIQIVRDRGKNLPYEARIMLQNDDNNDNEKS